MNNGYRRDVTPGSGDLGGEVAVIAGEPARELERELWDLGEPESQRGSHGSCGEREPESSERELWEVSQRAREGAMGGEPES